MINTSKIICRFREIHVVNEYGVFQAVYALVGKKAKDMWSKYDWFGQVRPFLTEKIRNRLQFHGCCFHNLHRSLGKPVLPSEYGGDQVAIVKIDNSTTGTSRDVGTLRYVKWLVLSYVHRVELHTVAWVLLSCVTCVELGLSLLSLHWYHSTIVLMIVILNDCFNTVAYGWMKKKQKWKHNELLSELTYLLTTSVSVAGGGWRWRSGGVGRSTCKPIRLLLTFASTLRINCHHRCG